MAFKEIVVHMNDSGPALARLRMAKQIATVQGAHLVGLFLVDLPPLPGYVAAQVSDELIAARQQGVDEQATRLQQAFKDETAGTGLTTEWRVSTGDTSELLCDSARRADLLVIGLKAGPDHLEREWNTTIGDVLLAAGVPVLLVPKGFESAGPVKRATVGWDGSRESTRAAHDALPLLVGADTVSVVAIDDESRAAEMAKHLERHGVAASSSAATSAGKPVGEALLACAKEQQADLLVTGGYGHSRKRELLLGGVTRHLLKRSPVPILMSH